MIDVTLACEDAHSKLVEVVTVADVDDKDRVGNSLLLIWKLRFGHKAELLFRLWGQGFVKILKLKFRQDLYDEKIFYFGKKLVELLTLATLITPWLIHSVTNFLTICFWRVADIWLRFWSWLRLWKTNLIKICVWSCDMTNQVTLVRWTQLSGPLCLWQCLKDGHWLNELIIKPKV